MKKLLLYSAAALLAAGALNAKTIDEVRIYLNPGHGSWGPNDRPNVDHLAGETCYEIGRAHV